jgi:uncharacterized protein
VSDIFGDDRPSGPSSQSAPEQPPRGRYRALLWTAAIVGAGLLGFTIFSSFWTDKNWFDSVGFAGTFSTLLWTRLGLFLAFGALMASTVAVNMVLAYRLRPVFRPTSPEQDGLDRYRDAIVPIRFWLVFGFAAVVGAFAGSSATAQWRNFLLWRAGGSFGVEDPYFGRDAGFYVFDLPWLHYLADFAMTALVIALLAAVVVHYLFGGIQLQNRQDRLSPAAKGHLSVLAGVFLLVRAADYWLDRFDLLSTRGERFTGMSYTGENAILPARNILAGIAVVCALLFFLNLWRRTSLLPSVGVGLMVLSAILLGGIWPAVVQRFQVSPTEADKEEPYIQQNIVATRSAYLLEQSKVTEYDGESDVASAELAKLAIDSPGARLIDPRLVSPAFEQLQQQRGYYSVSDVLDVDRYQVANGDGQSVERDMVVGVRELNQDGLPENSKNWSNLRTVYTHGYGVIAAYGNQRSAENGQQADNQEPAWAERDLPPEGALTDLSGEDGYEGRIYFGEQSPDYSVVGKASESARDVEFDIPGGDTGESEQTTTYAGKAGVPMGSLVNKLLFAIRFGEPNLVLSGRVNENSKILYDRNPRTMVEKVAPWLTVDEDPFPAVVGGRVVWILDGYTTTNMFPQSQRESFQAMTDDALTQGTAFQTLPTDEINYMRNAVKATVDAYDGTVTLYEWDQDDPILAAWRQAFPGSVRDRSEIPDELLAHMRYPEDLFKVQRFQFASYHVTDAVEFYRRDDQWEVPNDPEKPQTLQPPYRLSVSTPSGGSTPSYSLTSVFEPNKRNNLAAFVSVDAAADDAGDYGTLQVLRVTSPEPIAGPSQIANKISADEDVKNELLKFRQSDAIVRNGNLLTLPVGGKLLYVQPIYVERSTGEGNYPVLTYVAASFGEDNVGIGTTLDVAVNDLLGIDEDDATPTPDPGPGPGGGDPSEPTGPLSAQVVAKLEQADRAFAAAETALRSGDLEKYAAETERARDLVDEALDLAEKQAGRGKPAP